MKQTFDITELGAVGDGQANCWAAVQDAVQRAAQCGGCVVVPAGRYLVEHPVVGLNLARSVSLRGEGQNVSVLVGAAVAVCLSVTFLQQGGRQPWGLNVMDVGFEAQGECGTAVKVSYGNPSSTSEHYRPSTSLRGVVAASGPQGSWLCGADFEAAWNVTVAQCCFSGYTQGTDWSKLRGVGIRMTRFCVNSRFTDCQVDFWETGFLYHSLGGGNTEGLFFVGCTMVGVQRGCWVIGNADASAPRVSTFSWQGGMIECRVGGVAGGTAAFHMVNVWTVLIGGCQMLAETIEVRDFNVNPLQPGEQAPLVRPALHETYGIFLDNCNGVVVGGCDINAWHLGLFTVGRCSGVCSHHNTYTNVARQNVFTEGTVRSRSGGHVRINNAPRDEDNTQIADPAERNLIEA